MKKEHLIPLWLIVCLVGFPQLSETIYTPSLPDIAKTLGVGSHLVEWTLSAYFIGFSLGVFLWGIVCDKWGRRVAMLSGIAVYALACFGCLFSPGISALLLSRVIQGLGASVGSIVTQTMIRDTYHGTERNQIYSLIAIALAIAPALGPFIGGWLVHWFSWRSNFVFLSLMGLILLSYNSFRLPETKPKGEKSGPVNFVGVLNQMRRDPRIYTSILLVGGLNGIVFSFYAEAPFLLIKLLHFPVKYYGIVGLVIACASVIGGKFSHHYNHQYPLESLILFGLWLSYGAMWLLMLVCHYFYVLHPAVTIAGILMPMAIVLIGFTITIPNVLSSALEHYAHALGTAGAIFGLAYYLLIAFLTFIMGLIHNGTPYPMPLYFLVLGTFMLGAGYLRRRVRERAF